MKEEVKSPPLSPQTRLLLRSRMEDWSHQGSLAAVRLAARHAASLPPPPRSHPTPKRPVKPPPPGGVYTGRRASRVATIRLRLNSNDEEGLLVEIQHERMARRRAEWAEAKQKEVEAIAIELARPSKWDKIGCAVLKAALLTTVLVDAWWLWQLAEDGGVLPRSQDLPPGARVTLAGGTSRSGKLKRLHSLFTLHRGSAHHLVPRGWTPNMPRPQG